MHVLAIMRLPGSVLVMTTASLELNVKGNNEVGVRMSNSNFSLLQYSVQVITGNWIQTFASLRQTLALLCIIKDLVNTLFTSAIYICQH